MTNYITSPITTYCEDNELFETKVGTEAAGMPLYYTVWGKTEYISRERANNLVLMLNSISLPLITE